MIRNNGVRDYRAGDEKNTRDVVKMNGFEITGVSSICASCVRLQRFRAQLFSIFFCGYINFREHIVPKKGVPIMWTYLRSKVYLPN